MSSSSSALPTPRQLLTSILNAISQIPAPTAPTTKNERAQGSSAITRTGSLQAHEPATNPLRLVDHKYRPLFTTLHVLFPSLLLPALDLLDRGLVTRLLSPEEHTTPAEVSGQDDDQPHEPRQEDEGDMEMRDPPAPPTTPASMVYLVRSAQKPARRPYGGGELSTTSAPGSSSSRTYIVHTAAWNCTCAAFAFAAFPPLTGPSLLLTTAQAEPQDGAREADLMSAMAMAEDVEGGTDGEEEEGRSAWQFGGASFDGTGADVNGGGGVPPCCKHLLACVLAERWGRGLGSYVAQREVGREEMAGVFADI